MVYHRQHGYRTGKTWVRRTSTSSFGKRNFTMPVESRSSGAAATDVHAGARPALVFA
jgi:hypothetical protein